MNLLNTMEIYCQGLKSFDALTPLERDVFMVCDLDFHCEIEDGLGTYRSHNSKVDLLRLGGTLQRIGDFESASIVYRAVSESPSELEARQIDHRRLNELRFERWNRLCDHAERHGMEISD